MIKCWLAKCCQNTMYNRPYTEVLTLIIGPNIANFMVIGTLQFQINNCYCNDCFKLDT